jgi:hypothetical protein
MAGGGTIGGGTIEVRGIAEVLSALGKVNSESKKVLVAALREAAWPVQSDTKSRLHSVTHKLSTEPAGYQGLSYDTIGIAVRSGAGGFAAGVAVTQRKKKVTGRRGDFGALQMERGFIPALEANREETYKGVELAFDTLITESGF